MNDWPKGPTTWLEDRRLFVSVPFTWNLSDVRAMAAQRSFLWDAVTVGGPAVKLSQGFSEPFRWHGEVTVDYGDMLGVLERVNPSAMRTSTGCPNRCGYCGVSRIEPVFAELPIKIARPVVCDNNFLACSEAHRAHVYHLLEGLDCVDFNQGLDARRLTVWDARRLRRLDAKCRLAYDGRAEGEAVTNAISMLRKAGIPKKRIYVYALIGWKDEPRAAWERCKEIESWGVYCCPMWFHELDTMEWNKVTEKQEALGWDEQRRLRIMGYFWKHRGTPEK